MAAFSNVQHFAQNDREAQICTSHRIFLFGVICFPQTEICFCAHIMVCAYEDRHMYECGCASGHCCAGRTAECVCVCVFELLSGALLMRFFHILDVPVNQRTLRWPVYFFAHPTGTHTFLCPHKSTLTFTPTPTLLQTRPHIWPFGLLAPNPLDNWTVRSHTHTLNAVFLSAGCQSV